MDVSVLIPAYNEADYISTTVAAVQKQNFKGTYEIIVIDNNSSDDTFQRAKEVEGIIVIKETQQGVQFAREAGRRMATGKIIVNIDADCVPDEEWLARGVQYLEDNNKCVAVSGPYHYYDASLSFRLASDFFLRVAYPLLSFFATIISHRAVILGGNVFIRANALAAIGGYNTDIEFYGDDTDTAKRLSRIGKVIFTPKLVLKSSARRFERNGTLKTVVKYWTNFFAVAYFGGPIDKKYD